MEYYRRFSSFYSNILSKIGCKTTSGFQKYNEPNDVSLNMSVHKDVEEESIVFNDNDEKLPSVVEKNDNDNLAINNNDEKFTSVFEPNNNDEKLTSVFEPNNNDEKLTSVFEPNNNDEKLPSVIENHNIHHDSDDEFKEFEQFKKVDQDGNNEYGVECSDIEYDITMITSNEKI